MRDAELQKVKPVIYIIGDTITELDQIPDDLDEAKVERVVKDQFRQAEVVISTLQKEMVQKQDGYIVHLDNVYKVHHSSGLVKIIHGQEAKEIKRRIKNKG